jgi:hypothetical protein
MGKGLDAVLTLRAASSAQAAVPIRYGPTISIAYAAVDLEPKVWNLESNDLAENIRSVVVGLPEGWKECDVPGPRILLH